MKSAGQLALAVGLKGMVVERGFVRLTIRREQTARNAALPSAAVHEAGLLTDAPLNW
jgi:hypothetical protein